MNIVDCFVCILQVDPAILGGMVVTIGDKYVDMSTASKIKMYTNVIKEAIQISLPFSTLFCQNNTTSIGKFVFGAKVFLPCTETVYISVSD